MADAILYSLVDNIATITFNRPDVMNSFDKKMADEMATLTQHINDDVSVRAVLLKGAGDLFMAGGDLKFFHHMLETMPVGVRDMIHTLNISITNLMQMSKPVVACVHGSVAGVGMSFMMACDLVIAAENTKFTMAYSGIGITPDGGATFNLPRLVGTKKAMEWLLLSGVFDAHTAQAYGLVNWVAAPEILREETHRLMMRLANGPSKSYAHIKHLVNQSWQNPLDTQLEQEALAFEACTTTADFKAGVTAFLQKKKPSFTGK